MSPVVAAQRLVSDLNVRVLALVDPDAAELVDETVPVAAARADPGVGLEGEGELEEMAIEAGRAVALLHPHGFILPALHAIDDPGVKDAEPRGLAQAYAFLHCGLVVRRDEQRVGCEGVGRESDEGGGGVDEPGGRHEAHLEMLVPSADVGVDDPRGQGEGELPPAQGRDRLDSLGVEAGEERAALGAPSVDHLLVCHARVGGQEGPEAPAPPVIITLEPATQAASEPLVTAAARPVDDGRPRAATVAHGRCCGPGSTVTGAAPGRRALAAAAQVPPAAGSIGGGDSGRTVTVTRTRTETRSHTPRRR